MTMVAVMLVVVMLVVVLMLMLKLPTCQGYCVQQPEVDTVGHNRPAKITINDKTYRKRRPDTSYTTTNLSTPSPGGKFLTCRVHGRCEAHLGVWTQLTHESWRPYGLLVWLRGCHV